MKRKYKKLCAIGSVGILLGVIVLIMLTASSIGHAPGQVSWDVGGNPSVTAPPATLVMGTTPLGAPPWPPGTPADDVSIQAAATQGIFVNGGLTGGRIGDVGIGSTFTIGPPVKLPVTLLHVDEFIPTWNAAPYDPISRMGVMNAWWGLGTGPSYALEISAWDPPSAGPPNVGFSAIQTIQQDPSYTIGGENGFPLFINPMVDPLNPMGSAVAIGKQEFPKAMLDVESTGVQLRLTHWDDTTKTPTTIFTDFSTNNNGYLYINPSGSRVGINNPAPSYELDVNGDARVMDSFMVHGNTLFVDSGDDEVGIGTGSPEATLHLKDNIDWGPFIILDRTSNPNFDDYAYLGVHGSGSNDYFYISPDYDDVNKHYLTVNLNSNGYVGIGTNLPSEELEVNGDVKADSFIGDLSGDFIPSGDLDMKNNLILNIGDSATDFTSGGGLNVAGKVAIGKTSPNYMLEVKADTSASDPFFSGSGNDDLSVSDNFQGSSPMTYKVQIDDDVGNPDSFKWSDDGGSTWEATGVDITGGVQMLNNGVMIQFSGTDGHVLNDYWTFTFSVTNPLMITSGAGTVNFYAGNDGKVGIKTPNPHATLDVYSGNSGGTADSTSDVIIEDLGDATLQFLSSYLDKNIIYFGDTYSATPGQINYNHYDNSMNFYTSGSQNMIIKGGQVGIGTTSLGSYKLKVSGDLYADRVDTGYGLFEIGQNLRTSDAVTFSTINTGYGGYEIGQNLRTSDTVSFASIGVADSVPDAKLDVLNTGTGDSFRVDDSAEVDSTPFVIDKDGDVGIGVAAPTKKVDVNGDVKVSGDLILSFGSTIYFGDPNTDGSWKLDVDSNYFYAMKRISGAWYTQGTLPCTGTGC